MADNAEFRDDLAALVATADQLSSMCAHVAEPVAAFYHALVGRDVSDHSAGVLAAVFLQHLLNGGTDNS